MKMKRRQTGFVGQSLDGLVLVDLSVDQSNRAIDTVLISVAVHPDNLFATAY